LNQQVDLGLWHRLSQLVIGLIVLACLLGIFFWYLPVFQQNARMRQHIMTLDSQIQVEEEKKSHLETSIKNLREDPKTVERLAREKLGYAMPGETVIFFEPPRPSY
jgi:cell division protein FtsB